MISAASAASFRLSLAVLLSLSWTVHGIAQSGSSTDKQAGQAKASDSAAPQWPRSFETPAGAAITLHQPQVTQWTDFKNLTALIASEYAPKGSDDPAFGVIEVTADTVADRETDEVTLTNIAVKNINFSTLPRDAMSDASIEVGSQLPTAPITLSLTRLAASLENYERLQNTQNLATDAPSIFVSEKPAVLLQTNGKVTTAPVKESVGLEFVVNTNWDVLIAEDTETHYLRIEKSWVSSPALDGPWTAVTELPVVFNQLPQDDNWKDAREAMPPQPFKDDVIPMVIYSDKPAELVVIDGKPALEPVPNTSLEWVSNANSDMFYDQANSTWYFLTSGRWFSATDLKGPWAFASENLPSDFLKIPDGQPYSIVRASVPGTSESEEARLMASIPTTAQVSRSEVTVDVTYYGDPEFVNIAGTDLAYAVNTEFTVIRVDGKYFVLYNGVWFVGDTPTGPFVVTDTVPDSIYGIPPSSPVYNATYVRVYQSTPTYVTYGYTSGYMWAFLAWGTFVYGTGYYYPPYWVYRPGYPPIYRPWRVTYGSGTYYLPGRGTFTAHYGRAYGPYGGISAAGVYNQNTGAYIRGGQAWGPYNHAGYVSVRGPGGNKYWVADINGNIYKSWDRGVTTSNTLAKGEGGAQNRWQTRDGNQNLGDKARNGDLYGDKDGNVFRNKDGNWQQHKDGKWNDADKPSRKADQAKTTLKKKTTTRKKTTTTSTQSRKRVQSLNNQRAARQRGSQRAQVRRSSQNSGRSNLQRPTTRNFERRRR
ncbi:MAG: hypothetical protein GY789_03040 [Hyphomicrobiales bacterium]|nr:hypothetical protein [Hyphomicrobiales bacterium]MCP5001708.1 hypothetical protein [Hyphomicrobiales bacterium]